MSKQKTNKVFSPTMIANNEKLRDFPLLLWFKSQLYIWTISTINFASVKALPIWLYCGLLIGRQALLSFPLFWFSWKQQQQYGFSRTHVLRYKLTCFYVFLWFSIFYYFTSIYGWNFINIFFQFEHMHEAREWKSDWSTKSINLLKSKISIFQQC